MLYRGKSISSGTVYFCAFSVESALSVRVNLFTLPSSVLFYLSANYSLHYYSLSFCLCECIHISIFLCTPFLPNYFFILPCLSYNTCILMYSAHPEGWEAGAEAGSRRRRGELTVVYTCCGLPRNHEGAHCPPPEETQGGYRGGVEDPS